MYKEKYEVILANWLDLMRGEFGIDDRKGNQMF